MSTATSPRRRRSVGSSVAAQHAEWLGLIDVSGPFLSLGVLLDAFPQGLDADDLELAARLRQALAEWQANRELRRPDPAIHQAFVRFVVGEVLGYPDDLVADGPAIPELLKVTPPEARAPIRPDLTLGHPGERPVLLVSIQGPTTSLDRPLAEPGFHASPDERMRQLLRETGIASGLVTNGEKWALVHAPPDRTATFATWDANDMLDERLTLRAFRSLAGARRTLGQAPDASLDGLLERSRDDEREVTDRLGTQTRRAVETLVSALDRADRETGGRVIEAVRLLDRNEEAERTLYESAVVVAMRVVFLLAAEARGLLPSVEEWTRSYAVTPLRSELEAVADRSGEELLDHRYDAWPRLLATFRAVHGGIAHDRVRLIGYGGGLFDPTRYLFLETAAGRPHGISNRVILRILESLQTLEVEVPGGGRERRPLSYQALGVEQIGHVYERLLDHTAIRATAPAVGLLGSARKEPEVALDILDAKRAEGEQDFLDFLKEETGRNLRSRVVAAPSAERLERLAVACGHDEELIERVRPYLGIIRDDGYGYPMVFRADAVFVTESPERRATGTHYTPPSLTEPIVKHALDLLVYDGPAAGELERDWRLRRPNEILALKVCDLAMGSAAFLVAAARYLGIRLVSAWDEHPGEAPDDLPTDLEERTLVARRLVAERCLYGVDKNPLAVEIAKVSLWLETLQKDRPFTFVDHALRAGDSLVGVIDLRQLEDLSLRPDERTLRIETDAARAAILSTVSEARRLREKIEATDVVDLRDVEGKAALLAAAEEATARLRQVGDLVCGISLRTAGSRESDVARDLIQADADAIATLVAGGDDGGAVERAAMEHLLFARAPGDPNPPRPFHWALEFPEVFGRNTGGFDSIIGNPPFLGDPKIKSTLGTPFREYLVRHVADAQRGRSDLAGFFLRRIARLTRSRGSVGVVATNTISQGDTREIGLDQMVAAGWQIYRATKTRPWPGEAALYVSQVWAASSLMIKASVLDDQVVPTITSTLDAGSRVEGSPHRLHEREGTSFQGTVVVGDGFLLTANEAAHLVSLDPRNKTVIKPYAIAQDLTSRPDTGASRWILDFGAMDELEAASFTACWDIVQERVRPVRQRVNDEGEYVLRKPLPQRYWQFGDKRPTLYRSIAKSERVLVGPQTSKYWFVMWVPTGWVYSHGLYVFLVGDSGASVLTSSFHEAWARRYSSSLKFDLRYSPTDCYQNFPFPPAFEALGAIGAEYLDHRKQTMLAESQGLTQVYNRVHETTNDRDGAINRLRTLRIKLDRAVADAYGWSDLELDHDHRETSLGLRFTLSDAVRTEALDRLLELNHERYAEERARGLGGGKKNSRS
jgi:hypothetical protein